MAIETMLISEMVSVAGILMIFIGTYGLALPDLDRKTRKRTYCMAPHLRKMYKLREETREIDRGWNIITENKTICYTFIDFIERKELETPPDDVPTQIRTGGAEIVAKFNDGTEEAYYRGGDSRVAFIQIVSLALERRARIMGISIALMGTIVALVGTVL